MCFRIILKQMPNRKKRLGGFNKEDVRKKAAIKRRETQKQQKSEINLDEQRSEIRKSFPTQGREIALRDQADVILTYLFWCSKDGGNLNKTRAIRKTHQILKISEKTIHKIVEEYERDPKFYEHKSLKK